MKKIIFLSVFLLFVNYAQSQGKYYYAFEEKIFLNEVEDKVVLRFDKSYLSNIQDDLQKNVKVQYVEFINDSSYCILTTEKPNVRELMESLSKQAGIKSINPLYIAVSGLEMGITDEIRNPKDLVYYGEGI
jgi:hypothetical protein